MAFESQKVDLEVTGARVRQTLTICNRIIETYEQLDRYIEILESHRKSMRDGKPAQQDGHTINCTI